MYGYTLYKKSEGYKKGFCVGFFSEIIEALTWLHINYELWRKLKENTSNANELCIEFMKHFDGICLFNEDTKKEMNIQDLVTDVHMYFETEYKREQIANKY